MQSEAYFDNTVSLPLYILKGLDIPLSCIDCSQPCLQSLVIFIFPPPFSTLLCCPPVLIEDVNANPNKRQRQPALLGDHPPEYGKAFMPPGYKKLHWNVSACTKYCAHPLWLVNVDCKPDAFGLTNQFVTGSSAQWQLSGAVFSFSRLRAHLYL